MFASSLSLEYYDLRQGWVRMFVCSEA